MNTKEDGTHDYQQQYLTIGIALAGVYATGIPKVYSNSQTRSHSNIPDNRLTPYLGELVEGGVVIDKRTVDESVLIQYVISGPMLDETLPDGHLSRLFEKPEPFSSDMGHLCDLKGFDYLSLDLYVNLWQFLDAKIGYRIGNVIEWSDGNITDIPSFETRFAAMSDSWDVRKGKPW